MHPCFGQTFDIIDLILITLVISVQNCIYAADLYTKIRAEKKHIHEHVCIIMFILGEQPLMRNFLDNGYTPFITDENPKALLSF